MKATIQQGKTTMVAAEILGAGSGDGLGEDFDPNWAPKVYKYTPDYDGCPYGTAHTTFKTVTGKYGYENSWEIPDVGPVCNGAHFLSHSIKHKVCCLPLGEQTITCVDDQGDGWGKGYVEVNGQKLCETFSDGAFKKETFQVGQECFDTAVTIVTADDGLENSWTLSGCTGGPYNSNSNYVENCCVSPGVYSLSCIDEKGDGWQGGYLEINGERYCDDFYSGTRFVRPVTIYPNIKIGETGSAVNSVTQVSGPALFMSAKKEIVANKVAVLPSPKVQILAKKETKQVVKKVVLEPKPAKKAQKDQLQQKKRSKKKNTKQEKVSKSASKKNKSK